MGIIRKQSFFSSIILYIGMAFGFVLILFVYPKYLSPEEIGLVRVIIDIAALLSPYILLGVPNTYVRYFPYFLDDKTKLAVFRFYSILIPSISTLIFLGIYKLCEGFLIASFKAQSELLIEFLDFIPILIFIMGGNQILRAFYRSELDIVTPNFYESILLRIFFGAAVLSYYYFQLEVKWLVYFFLIAHAVIFILMIIGFVVDSNFKIAFNRSLTKIEVNQIIVFGLFVTANTLTGAVILRLDTWMLSSLSGLAATGIYSVAMQMGTVIDLPKRSFSQITTPVISQSFKDNDWKQIKEIYHKTSLNQLLIGGFIFIVVWSNAHDLFSLIPNGEEYAAGIWVLLYIGLSKLFSIATGSTMEILQVSKYYRHTIWISLSLVFSAILLNLWLIPIYGITGAAIASAVAQLLHNLILLFFVWWKLKMQPFNIQNLYGLLFLGALMSIFYLFVFNLNPIVNVAIRSMIAALIMALGILYLPISEDLRQMLKMVLKRVNIRL